MSDLRFDGRVVIVTGAGAGLGRSYALLFASRGAKVVVNDLGVSRDGSGSSQRAADVVVDEIKRSRGIAVADYNSVSEGQKIVKTALDNFGRVDVLINNAGILRDRSFAKLTDIDWNLIQEVHLKGSFKTSQAAFVHMKKQQYGRIIMTSSGSGLYGNFGQANYAAAKTGILGLTNAIKIEGGPSNIHCNVIVPTAASRLTKDILPPELYNELKPELIAPVVAYLCHESCKENGAIIQAAAGWAGKVTLYQNGGVMIRKNIQDCVSIENVKDSWQDITDMHHIHPSSSVQEATAALVESIERLKSGTIEEPAHSRKGDVFTFYPKDLVLYALGVGASVQEPGEMKFLYESHEDFSPLPTFYIMPGILSVLTTNCENAVPGKNISFEQILHGEQYLEIVNSVPQSGTLLSKSEVVEVLDKNSGAAIVFNTDTYNEIGYIMMKSQVVSFAVGAGGFGGPRNGKLIKPCIPKPDRQPDCSLFYKTSYDQAALYRLSGDINPLHIDPSIATLAGYERPILHGLCSLGISVRLVMKAYGNYNLKFFKAVKARFSKTVLPGETLRVDMWRNGNRIHFETVVTKSHTPIITGAYVDLNTVKMEPIQSNVYAQALKSDAVFDFISNQLKTHPEKAKHVNAIFLYKITKDGKVVKEWTMDLKSASIYEGDVKEGKPNTTITIADEDFVDLAVGKLNPQQAFMKGKLKVTGNLMLAQKLGPLLKAGPKL